jgi:hypothetical protein
MRPKCSTLTTPAFLLVKKFIKQNSYYIVDMVKFMDFIVMHILRGQADLEQGW